MNAKEAGQAFLADVLAKISDPELQAAARTAFEKSEDALSTLGAGTLRQSDYSRAMDQARQQAEATTAWKQQLDDWYAANQAKLEAQANPTPNPQPQPTPTPTPAPQATPGYLTREELEKERKAWEAQYAGALAATTSMAAKHYAEFQEALDVEALIRDPEINQLGLAGVYDKTFKARYAEKAQKAYDAKVEADVQKRLAEARAADPRLPYPIAGRPGNSALSAIEDSFATKIPVDPANPTATPKVSVVDLAVQDYNAALARRGDLGGY